MYHYKEKQPPFVLVKSALLDDKTWQRLSSTAKVLWLYLRKQYNPYKENINPANGKLQVRLSYSKMRDVRDFKSSKSMWKAIRELQQAGFIEITDRGGKYAGASAYSCIGKFSKFQNRKKDRGCDRGCEG